MSTASKKITINFTGDSLINSKNGECDFIYDLEEIFKEADLNVINLETVVSNRIDYESKKEVNIKCNSDRLNILDKYNIGIVNIANNHIYDYGESGVRDTIKNLKKYGVNFVGRKKDNVVIKEIKGVKIAFIGVYQKKINQGSINEVDYVNKTLFKNISKVKESVDILILNIHWGIEFSKLPQPKQRKLGKRLVDSGVDLVIGHHPHIIQGKEVYKGKNIYYSLGNFNFFKTTREFETDDNFGIIVKCEIDPISKKIKTSEVPIEINQNWIPKQGSKNITKLFKKRTESIKSMTYLDFYEDVEEIYFKNNYHAWENRIQKYGNKQIIFMIIWTIAKPFNYMCLLGKLKKKVKRDKKNEK